MIHSWGCGWVLGNGLDFLATKDVAHLGHESFVTHVLYYVIFDNKLLNIELIILASNRFF